MIQVYQYDSNGYYTEPMIINDKDKIPLNSTVVIPPDGLFKPQFLNDAWIEGETQANLLTYAKNAKIAELNSKCDSAIMGGFKSSALGSEHTYQSLIVDEVWLNSTINRFSIDPNFTTVNYKTIDAGYLPHTKTQFYQVFIDGHSWGDAQIAHLNDLKAKVNAAPDQTTLDGITW